MAIQIQFRRGTATEWSTVNPILALAEMGIETDTDLFKIGNGALTWNNLDYGGIQGYAGSRGYAGSIGTIAVQNVLYVSKSGNDANDGTSFGSSKLTIKAAVLVASTGTTIFVKSGDYTENTPINVPDFVSIIGDNLRSVTVRPTTSTNNVFYVNNGTYIAHMTFKGHTAPSAAISFNPNGSAGVISTSPYVQNCTSMTTDGTGMRVDGDYALGTKSMMVDAFTQYNQGGIGIHMLNSGYTSLVSVFTICCDVGFLCETGGFCSITNSNSSFGNYALKAVGVSPAKYTGKVVNTTSGRTITIDNLSIKPSIGDGISFGTSTYYTIASATAFKAGNTDIVYPVLTAEDAGLRNARQVILDEKSNLQILTINHVLEEFPGFDFNQFKCSRDVGLILDAVAYDMVLNNNYQTVKAGTSYYRATGAVVVDDQLTETLSAIGFLKTKTLSLLTIATTAYTRTSNLFDILLDILENGLNVAPAFTFTSPTGASTATVNAGLILQANRSFIAEETVAYINTSFVGLVYSTATCKRDVGYVIDAVTYDVLYGGNSQTADAADAYYDGAVFQIPANTTTATIAAYNFIKTIVDDCIINNVISPTQQLTVTQDTSITAATSTQSAIAQALVDIVVNIIENAYSSTITLQTAISPAVADNTVVSFHQYSQIQSSAHNFEWIGAGININAALPYLGGEPNSANQAVALDGGKVYFTGTDQQGDFRIGNDLVINNSIGTISGRTFTKSLFAVMTPYILAIGR
jgi:hypothetical protein